MKTYQSNIENTWVEIIYLPLTREQRRSLDVTEPVNIVEVSPEKTAKLNTLYESKKPVLNEGQVYSFISMDVFEDNSNVSGILNCRVDDEHTQIRF